MELGTCHKDTYLNASFKGFEFECIEVSSSHGRKGAEGEFPFGNKTGYVDLSRKINRYELSARLANNNHLERSLGLIAVCESPGPGILVHPIQGVINAACVDLKVRNNIIEQQGVTWVDISFVEAELWNNGFGLVGSLIGIVLKPVLDASTDDFSASYSVRSDPVYLQDDTIYLAERISNKYADIYSQSTSPDGNITADLRQVSQDESLADSPSVMDTVIRRGSSAISKAYSDPNIRYQSFRDLANWASSQNEKTDSQSALISHMRVTSGVYMASSALQKEYSSLGQAISDLDQTLVVLNEEADIAYKKCDNSLFLYLRKFISEFTRKMYEISYGSPRVIEYNFGGPVSSLVAAYSIWDDSKRARELGDSFIVGPIVQAGL